METILNIFEFSFYIKNIENKYDIISQYIIHNEKKIIKILKINNNFELKTQLEIEQLNNLIFEFLNNEIKCKNIIKKNFIIILENIAEYYIHINI